MSLVMIGHVFIHDLRITLLIKCQCGTLFRPIFEIKDILDFKVYVPKSFYMIFIT